MKADQISIGDLARAVIEAAKRTGTRIITAESCTAGAISTVLAHAPGSGAVLQGGFVTYSKDCKSAVLGVAESILARSAVTEAVAQAMAEGALNSCPCSDIAIAVTGVAGPEPDEDGNPVGLACISTARRNGSSRTFELHAEPDSAGQVRGELVRRSLQVLLNALKEQVPGQASQKPALTTSP